MKPLCIIGTDTNVGKTIVTAGLFNCLVNSGHTVETQKWVSTGDISGISDDLKFVYNSLYLNENSKLVNHSKKKIVITKKQNPYSFKFPASPHLSAALENKKISAAEIIKAYNQFNGKYDFLLIEGAGGLLTPLNDKLNFADLLKKLKIPVLLVVRNTLGSINQTLLTSYYLKKNKIKLTGIVFNNFYDEKKNIQNENIIYLITKIQPERALVINKISTKKKLIAAFTEFTKSLYF